MNEIVAWGKKNYVLGAGNDRSGAVDLEESAPQCVKVCEDRLDPKVKVQTVNKSTQSSGTILGEIITGHHLDRRGGNMAVNCQTDEDAKRFARTRLMPRVKKIPGIQCIMPNQGGGGRHSVTTTDIYFPDGTFLIVQGPGETNAQSFTASAVWNDEPYLYEPGRMLEFNNRIARMWNGKALNTSVGAKKPKTDLDTLYQEGTQEEWHHRCLRPGCGRLFLPTWWKTRYDKYVIQWDRAMEDGEKTNYAALGETARIVCPFCGEAHPDTRRVRRALTAFDRAAYVAHNPKGNPEKPSYRWNKQTPPDYRLAGLIENFLKAQASKRVGDYMPIQKFVMMDQAETYNRYDHETFGSDFTVPSADYELAEVDTPDFRRRFPIRFLGWDRQGGALRRREGVCRAYGKEGSRLVWTGTADDKKRARDIQTELGVRDRMTFQDCAWEPDEVYAECKEFGWIAIYGDDREEWPHEEDRALGKPKNLRPYSPRRDVRGAIRVSWSNPRIKAAVLALRTKQGLKDANGQPQVTYWGLPRDTPEQYLAQINQRPVIKPNGDMEWPENQNDHRHDCECFCEVGWQMLRDGLYPQIAPGGKILE